MRLQLNSSTAQQLVCFGVWCLTMLALAGCDPSAAATSSSPTGATTTGRATTIEAGVVLANRAGYLCLPLQQVGLLPDDQILSLSSSCECIAPRMVEYRNSSNAVGRAVLLEYVTETAGAHSDSAADASDHTVANLGVIIEATLADGRRHEFTVSLLHTYLKEEQYQ